MERESAGGEHNEGLPGYIRRASFQDTTEDDAAGTKKRLQSGTTSPPQRPAAKKLVFTEDTKDLEAESEAIVDAQKILEKRISDFRAMVQESKKDNSSNSGKNDDHDNKGFATKISDPNILMSNKVGDIDTEGFATVNSGPKNSVSNEGQESGSFKLPLTNSYETLRFTDDVHDINLQASLTEDNDERKSTTKNTPSPRRHYVDIEIKTILTTNVCIKLSSSNYNKKELD